MIAKIADSAEHGVQSVDVGNTAPHYGMADAARTATAGHSTQQAARSCDQSAKPGTDKETAQKVARYLLSLVLRSVSEDLLVAATRNDIF